MTYFRASTTAQLPTLMLQTCASVHDEAAYYTLSKMDATIEYIKSSICFRWDIFKETFQGIGNS